MALFPLDKLRAMRPDWCLIERGEFLVFPPGEGMPMQFSDANQVYLVLEGKVRTHDGSEELVAEVGDVLLVAAGVRHGFPQALEPTVVLRLADCGHPPFRDAVEQENASLPIELPPSRPLPSPRRRGVSVAFDVSSTFSPALLAAEIGGDLLLTANPGAMSRLQIDELRRHCLDTGRAIEGLILPLESEKEIEEFLRDPYQGGPALKIAPRMLAVEADLATEQGRRRAESVIEHWGARLHIEGMRPGAYMPVRRWDEAELHSMIEFLARIPPYNFGLFLKWKPGIADVSGYGRRCLEALLPWTAGVEFRGNAGFDEVAHYLDGCGFQGCAFRKL